MREIESMVNHQHLWDIFSSEQVSEGFLVALGEWISMCWANAAHAEFPDRCFRSRLENRNLDYGPVIFLHSEM